MPNILDIAAAAESDETLVIRIEGDMMIAEIEPHDTTFCDCEEMLTKCIDRLSADLPFMESEARERIVDLCFVYTRTYYDRED